MSGAVVPLRRPGLDLVAVKLIGKGSLLGLATVRLSIGLTVLDCPVFAGERGSWVGLPRRPSLDRDHRQRIGADGKLAFEPVAEWVDRKTADDFGRELLALLRAQYPDVLS